MSREIRDIVRMKKILHTKERTIYFIQQNVKRNQRYCSNEKNSSYKRENNILYTTKCQEKS